MKGRPTGDGGDAERREGDIYKHDLVCLRVPFSVDH